MRCFSCHKISLKTFCDRCQANLLKPTISRRIIDGMEVYSFFKYQNIEDLLLTKHTPQGYILYRALASFTFKPFMEEFLKHDSRELSVVGIDESVKSGYSHVALLTSAMRREGVKIEHASLMATNLVNYSGRTLAYRLKNPREFIYRGEENIEVILVDDIITTGTTLKEAKSVLSKSGVNVLFSLTLADVKV